MRAPLAWKLVLGVVLLAVRPAGAETTPAPPTHPHRHTTPKHHHPPTVAPDSGTTGAAPAKAQPAEAAAPAADAGTKAATKADKPAAPPKHPPPPPPDPTKGTSTGLPLPRFVSLRSDNVNLRTGPGTRYPIDWVYKRRELPVRIEREFDVWRLISAPDGTKGWVHQATLTGRRGFLVTGDEHVLRAEASETADAVARLKPGVVGRLMSCDPGAEWCRVQVKGYKGWLRRSDFWGTLPGEAVQP
ncbi:MAG TPA: SH3 domain-containing protein [Acetobacteraceae bacterium]|nr:SH3 domain-containing protein [Acetobacteraceae bacterium]